MIEIMDWGRCQREFIRKVDLDGERMASLQEKAKLRLKRAKNTAATEESASFIVEDYYEVIKELLVAYLLKNGLRAGNHQCLISYFQRQHPEYEREAVLMVQMSYFRNRWDYYGESIPLSFYKQHKEDFLRLIAILEKLLEYTKRN